MTEKNDVTEDILLLYPYIVQFNLYKVSVFRFYIALHMLLQFREKENDNNLTKPSRVNKDRALQFEPQIANCCGIQNCLGDHSVCISTNFFRNTRVLGLVIIEKETMTISKH